jgi:DNA-binding NtrC family response regulator
MAITVVLTVGWDPWILAAQSTAWRAAGYIAVSASSIVEAIRHFKAGDFDVVLLGKAMSRHERESLTRQIRGTGASAPVIDTTDLPDDFESLEKAVGQIASRSIPDLPAKNTKKLSH